MAVEIVVGDCIQSLRAMPAQSVNCCITSPPYFGLRDYGHEGQIGLEQTPNEFVAKLVEVFREVRRVLRDDGTLWLNLGDSYARPAAKGGSGPDGRPLCFNGEPVKRYRANNGYDDEGRLRTVVIPWAFSRECKSWAGHPASDPVPLAEGWRCDGCAHFPHDLVDDAILAKLRREP